ncbi:queuine tRNA-ribosyltransferase accessory subunit 2 [Copidosoma floridanum]|uniref:queuine tRNA-ribosyltransferase accessory subunit 2 n=1 Tax=Copidosoma floridanum TaxID=29053 RepID=UPI0006C95719|nr:queuine tRNA-ribosyltransferase accessory subunit 2 [Copidosoma floridanum]
MRFITDSLSCCSARLGVLTGIDRLPNVSFETPMLLLYTRRGSVPHLTKDVLKKLTAEQQFLLTNLPSTILMTDCVKQFDSFGEFVGLQEYPFFLGIQDPSEQVEKAHHRNGSVSVWSRNGRTTVTPDKYMDLVENFKPDVYVTLFDGDTDKDSSQKRINKSLCTSKNLFSACYKKHQESDVLRNKGFLGAVVGGYNLQARAESIKHMEGKELLGCVIDALHRNGIETQGITIDQVKPVIEHSLNLLPVDKLRVLNGCWNPSTILDLVNLGIDVFDSSYAFLMTEEKKSLTFLCDDCESCMRVERRFMVDLSEKRYKEDFDPICKSCTCLTCKNHTKAYIHHLIHTKELLSLVLLMIHNTHLYIEFFKQIRQSIKDGTFDEYRNKIHSRFLQMTENS